VITAVFAAPDVTDAARAIAAVFTGRGRHGSGDP